MSIRLKIPLQLQKYSGEKPEISFSPEGGKVSFKRFFNEIEALHPGMKGAIFGRDGNPVRFVNKFYNAHV